MFEEWDLYSRVWRMGNYNKQGIMVPERRVVATDRFRLLRRFPRDKREWWLGVGNK